MKMAHQHKTLYNSHFQTMANINANLSSQEICQTAIYVLRGTFNIDNDRTPMHGLWGIVQMYCD